MRGERWNEQWLTRKLQGKLLLRPSVIPTCLYGQNNSIDAKNNLDCRSVRITDRGRHIGGERRLEKDGLHEREL